MKESLENIRESEVEDALISYLDILKDILDIEKDIRLIARQLRFIEGKKRLPQNQLDENLSLNDFIV